MNYELAKKLKDAGFPFKEIKVGMYCPPGEEYFDFNPSGDPDIGPQHFFIPTLSELIKACGDKFGILNKKNGAKMTEFWEGEWHSCEETLGKGTPLHHVYGSTPEETVANLWLALNKKV